MTDPRPPQSLHQCSRADLALIEALTRYPSIPTYHTMTDRGRLTDEVRVEVPSDFVCTEKVDGVNVRVVVFPNQDFVVGTRTELVHARGDRVWNPVLDVVDALYQTELLDTVGRVADHHFGTLQTLYVEAYGGRQMQSGRNYSASDTVRFRAFDGAVIGSRTWSWAKAASASEIASWRDRDRSRFWSPFSLAARVQNVHDLDTVPTLDVPSPPPPDLAGARDWLRAVVSDTHVATDGDVQARSEGVVLRWGEHEQAKLRHQDYDRTLR